MTRIAEFIKLPIVLSALLASAGAASAQDLGPLKFNIATLPSKGTSPWYPLLAEVAPTTVPARDLEWDRLEERKDRDRLNKIIDAAHMKGKVLDVRLQGKKLVIKYLDENGQVKVIEVDASRGGGDRD